MNMPIGDFLGITWLFWWQPLLLILLIALIIFWRSYRNRQM
jgi:cytochrome c-type biogenesis protein CcmH/NrfF